VSETMFTAEPRVLETTAQLLVTVTAVPRRLGNPALPKRSTGGASRHRLLDPRRKVSGLVCLVYHE